MASVKNTPRHKRKTKSGSLILRSEHQKAIQKSKNELRAIRFLGLTAILLGAVALVLLGIRLFEGEAAKSNADALLEAYKARPTATPVITVTPSVTEEPPGTPEPADEDYEQTSAEADASAAQNANQHLADDGSVTTASESGEYVQPDEPEVNKLDETIARIIKATGEDGVIGILEIPRFDTELPIIGKWSYNLLKISVCRYKGPAPNEKGNLVIIGHNYKSGAHFGNLKNIEVGDELYLTNAKTGERVRYEVYQVKSIAPDAFSALDSYHGPAGLTLMTCRNNGTNRLLVRCEQKDAS
jgi:LPXTG-site transpeptidase (sortase) family protein